MPSVTKQKVQRKLQVLVGSMISDVRGLTRIIRLPSQQCSPGVLEFDDAPFPDILPKNQSTIIGRRQKMQKQPSKPQNLQLKSHLRFFEKAKMPSLKKIIDVDMLRCFSWRTVRIWWCPTL